MAGILAILGLTAAFVWGVADTITALDRVDDFDRVAIPGSIATTGDAEFLQLGGPMAHVPGTSAT